MRGQRFFDTLFLVIMIRLNSGKIDYNQFFTETLSEIHKARMKIMDYY